MTVQSPAETPIPTPLFQLPTDLQVWRERQHGLVYTLPLGALIVAGADARDFLHRQLTIDLRNSAPGQSRPAAWCTPRGRVWTVMQLVDLGDRFYLILPGDLVDAAARRLRMFVLRDAVTITVAAEPVHGLVGDNLDVGNQIRAITSPGRTLVLSTEASAFGESRATHSLPLAHWQLLELLDGQFWIGAATQDMWLPQMLNLDLLGGLDFNKGCYPGQEPIARVHYRGRVSRRTLLLRLAAGVMARVGTEVHTVNGELAGSIAMSAQADDILLAAAVIAVDLASQPLRVAGQSALEVLQPQVAV